MNVLDKLKIFKKNSMFPDMLFSYPSTYLFKRDNKELFVDTINFENNILYIHIPFCIKVCSFCTVHKTEYKNKYETRKYFDILYKEIDFFSKNINWKIKWIYIWGWTPTMISHIELENLFKKIYDNFEIKEDFNIEIDAHPSTLNENKLKVLSKYNVSQITMWIQSMQDNVLNTIWRLNHSYETLENLSEIFSKYKFNLHFDFVLGLPWDDNFEDIKKSVIFVIEKFSPYSISINSYDHTIDSKLYKASNFNFNDKFYKEKLFNDISNLNNFIKKNYNIKRKKTYYFKNFWENWYNVIWIWAGSYWFIKWKWFYKNYDYNEYLKNWFIKKWIKYSLLDEKIMFIIHNYWLEDINFIYEKVFWSSILDDFKDKIDYFLEKKLASVSWKKVFFHFKSIAIARFELIELYSDEILNLYK